MGEGPGPASGEGQGQGSEGGPGGQEQEQGLGEPWPFVVRLHAQTLASNGSSSMVSLGSRRVEAGGWIWNGCLG